MKQLLILSGKGGTGKTTVAGAFIRLSRPKPTRIVMLTRQTFTSSRRRPGSQNVPPIMGSQGRNRRGQVCSVRPL